MGWDGKGRERKGRERMGREMKEGGIRVFNSHGFFDFFGFIL